jgi:hypothetical protein
VADRRDRWCDEERGLADAGRGHASGPKALAVNPVTNKIYAAFANEVVVIDGGNNSLAYVPVPTGSVASIAINYFTNKVYVSSDGGNLTVIDGFTNATTALTVPGGTISIGMNPMTNEIITGGSTAGRSRWRGRALHRPAAHDHHHAAPRQLGDHQRQHHHVREQRLPNPLPVRGVYYQFDSIEGTLVARFRRRQRSLDRGPLRPVQRLAHHLCVRGRGAHGAHGYRQRQQPHVSATSRRTPSR